MKAVLISSLVVVAILLGAYAFVITSASRSLRASSVESRELLAGQELDCPPDTERTGQPWGKSGWSLRCEDSEGNPDGPWVAAEWGRLVLRGEYSNGVRSGTWFWYGEDGSISQKNSYDEGSQGSGSVPR